MIEFQHKTGIQWTHVPGFVGDTWNPTTGCTRVSPGCDNCYAFQLHDQRYARNREYAKVWIGVARGDIGGRSWPQYLEDNVEPEEGWSAAAREAGCNMPFPAQYDRPFSQVQLLPDERMQAPTKVRKPRAYFVDSMADLFHEDVSPLFLDRVWEVMEKTPQHRYLILTKRPERMRAYLEGGDALPNVALGTSVESHEYVDRIAHLLGTPAATRFVSYEPALGPVDWRRWLASPAERLGAARGIDWLIVGGESGSRSRPFDLRWAEIALQQGHAAGIAVFIKQLGRRPFTPEGDVKLRHSHGGDIHEWPVELRVREFPTSLL